MKTHRNLKYILIVPIFIVAVIGISIRSCNTVSRNITNPKNTTQTKIATPKQALPIVAKSKNTTGVSLAEKQNHYRLAFLTPIQFYGKIVDQFGKPVAEATAIMRANDNLSETGAEYKKNSDSNGLFSISGIRGLDLAVEVSKNGYRQYRDNDGSKITSYGVFNYGMPPSDRGPFNPTKESPAVFILYKIGPLEPLIKIEDKEFRIQRNGNPLTISLDQNNGHQVILRCWTKDLERPAGQNKYDWDFEITVMQGGLVFRKDLYNFEAPIEGYKPNDAISMAASLPFGYGGWSSSAKRDYFIRFDDQTFARVSLEMHAGGDHFVVWESYYNPKPNSRNLE